jgi:sigma-B regulation protein RsbU (phosphoserine phosphatase)
MFVTLLLGVLDLRTREMRYVRAGHIPPFHRNGTGAVGRLAAPSGPPLGLFENIAYQQAVMTLAPNDRLLIVTDGFTEAHDPSGQLYGEERVATFMATLDDRAEMPLARLVSDVRSFEAGRPAFDDMAAILLSLGHPAS